MRSTLIAIPFILIATTATAQFSDPLPRTINIHDTQGHTVGIGTAWGNKMVIRDLKGELIGTIVLENGRRNFYDPNGKQVEQDQVKLKFPLPEETPQ